MTLWYVEKIKLLDEVNRKKRYSNEHYIRNTKDLEKIYSDIPEALENNYNFIFRFNFKPKRSDPSSSKNKRKYK